MQHRTNIFPKTEMSKNMALTYKDLGLSTLNSNDDIVWLGSIGLNKNTKIKIKKESVSIELNGNETYESEYEYFAIEETPIFFLIPVYDTDESEPIDWRIDTVYYSMENNDLVDRAFFLHALEWINKYQEDSPFLTYLRPILNEIYKLTEEIVEDIEGEVELDDDDLEDAVLEALKPSFFDFYYDEAYYNVLESLRYDEDEDYDDEDGDYDEDEDYDDDEEDYDEEEDYYSADIKDFVINNETIKGGDIVWHGSKRYNEDDIDERVQDTLESLWIDAINGGDLVEDVKRAVEETITDASEGKDYSRQKMVAVMYHKKLASLIYIDGHINKSIHINIHIEKTKNNKRESNDKVIKLRYCTIMMATTKHIINVSFGSFNMVNRFKILNATSYEPKFADYDDLYYEKVHNVFSIKNAEYNGDGIQIEEITFDFLIPNKDFSSFKTKQRIEVTLDPNKMLILFKNGNQLFSMLMRASLFVLKMYNRVFQSDFDINSNFIMGYGFLLPTKYVSEE